ncbi:RND transporter, hydrophobe/amphiphile efflux-1 family protein, partial [Vibrio parahaemolyticus EKP-021]
GNGSAESKTSWCSSEWPI